MRHFEVCVIINYRGNVLWHLLSGNLGTEIKRGSLRFSFFPHPKRSNWLAFDFTWSLFDFITAIRGISFVSSAKPTEKCLWK